MYHRHRILDGDRLSAAGLQVKLGAAQTRQNKGLFRRQQVRAVELGADVNAELKVAHRRESAFVIRHRHGEVAPRQIRALASPAIMASSAFTAS